MATGYSSLLVCLFVKPRPRVIVVCLESAHLDAIVLRLQHGSPSHMKLLV